MEVSSRHKRIPMHHWAKRLRDWMDDAGVNVPELARLSGVQEASLYKYLKGRTAAPRGKILADLAGAFGKTAAELMYGTNVASPVGVVNIPLLTLNELGTIQYEKVISESWGGRVVQVASADLTEAAFAVEITDSACSPKIDAGDIVIVEPMRTAEPGGFVAAFVDSMKTGVVRKYRPRHAIRKDDFQLVSTNEDYPVIDVTPDNPGHILGKAVKVIKNL